jgi:hypothetical protein
VQTFFWSPSRPPCGIKAQIATVEERLILKVIGKLSTADQETLNGKLKLWLQLAS